MRNFLTIFILILLSADSNAQIQLHVQGDMYVRNKILFHPLVTNTGEYIVNNTGSSLSFYTKFLERLRIDNNGRLHIFQMDTTYAKAANLVRNIDGTIKVNQYKIGDFVHGGIVFWVDGSGQHGLVVDKSDLTNSLRWNNSLQHRTSAHSDGLGAGYMNTTLIIAVLQIDSFPVEMAAYACANLNTEGYADWYLPSKAELDKIYQNRAVINEVAVSQQGDPINQNSYWSSTESSASFTDAQTKAWSQDFSTGVKSESSKDQTYSVRAVRRF